MFHYFGFNYELKIAFIGLGILDELPHLRRATVFMDV